MARRRITRRRMTRRWWFAIAGGLLALVQIGWVISIWWNDMPRDFEPGETCELSADGFIRAVGTALQYTCVYESGSVEYVPRAVIAQVAAVGFAAIALLVVFLLLSRPYRKHLGSMGVVAAFAGFGLIATVPLVGAVTAPVVGPGPTAIHALHAPVQKLLDDSLAAAGSTDTPRLTLGPCPDAAPGNTWNLSTTIDSSLDPDTVVSSVAQVWINAGFEFADPTSDNDYHVGNSNRGVATDLRITRVGGRFHLEVHSTCAVGWVG